MRITGACAILIAGLGMSGCTVPPHLVSFDTPPPQHGGAPAGAQEMLALHNAKRRAHCAPDLTWSSELAAAAQAWADRCEFAHAPRSVNPSQGENLARGAGSLGAAAFLFNGWYDEVRQYNFAAPGYQKGTGHFTQIVWRDTREVGCAVASCSGKSFWVCRYAPMGNIVKPAGYFEKNVLPAGCQP
jgi:uncharacterized protein YkwD